MNNMRNKILSLLVLLLTAASGAWAEDTYTVKFEANGNSKTIENVTLPRTFSCDYDMANGELDDILKELYGWTGGPNTTFCDCVNAPSSGDPDNVAAGLDGYNQYLRIEKAFEGTVTVTGKYIVGSQQDYSLEISLVVPDVTVTTNAASEGATFTEATFQMPAYDATAEYELVRDMSVQMTTQVGDGKDGFRIRIKKNAQSGKYEPAEMEFQDMLALFSVTDQIEEKSLVCYGQGAVCQLKVYAVDDNDQPTGDPILFANLEPGRYAVKAVAADGSDYDGETALSNIFKLYQGYEVTVPAKEFITYYKDEPLRVEDEAAELYTISSVNDDTAVLSQPSDAMPSYTPMLVYNTTDETKVFLLIPCNEPDLALTVAPEFIGTLEATTIAASSASQTNYAFNGKQFVWVKTAIEVGQYKAWLEVPAVSNVKARAISLVFEDGTTKITNTNLPNLTNGDWYDLNGRKLNRKPTAKGVYIFNGQKVVVK